MWKEAAASKIFNYQGLTICTELDKSWTIMSSVYNHLWQRKDKGTSELRTLIQAEEQQQERLAAMGYRSPTWMLRALQSLLSAVQLQGDSAVTSPPFFPSAGRGTTIFPSAGRGTTRFWGKEQGPTVFLWESLGEEGREECERAIHTHKEWVVWVVWSRARPAKGDCKLRGFDLLPIGQLGGYGFQGVALGVDGSCKDGKMGSGCCKFKEEGEGRRARVGRKATLATAPDADILREIVCLLTQRVRAGRATFLI